MFIVSTPSNMGA